jgi:hypothetical protein
MYLEGMCTIVVLLIILLICLKRIGEENQYFAREKYLEQYRQDPLLLQACKEVDAMYPNLPPITPTENELFG